MILRQFLVPETACASYLFGCTTHGELAVVDPHASLVDEYVAAAEQIDSPIVGVFETHVQADHVVLYPSHFGGSVCGRGLSGNPVSSIGFERTDNPLLAIEDAKEFAAELLVDLPPSPAGQAAIVAANRAGSVAAPA